MFRRFRLRFGALFGRDDVSDELELHLDQLADELAAQGLNPREARLAAARQFGNLTAIKEQSHELFSFRLLTDLLRDLTYAGRVFRRTPMFLAGAAFVLALGIGANCTIFNLVYSVLLKPLPYDRPEEVVMVGTFGRRPGGPLQAVGMTWSEVGRWRDRAGGVFADLAVMKMWQGNPEAWFDLVLPDRAERIRAGLVTPNFFTVLGSHASIGRVFSASDEAGGHDDLVVLSHGFWQRAFGGDPGVVGRRLTFITGRGKTRAPRPYTVVGVLHQGFRFTYPLETEVWAMHPWRTVEASRLSEVQFNGAVARLAPGVSVEAAQARISEGDSIDRPDSWVTKVQRIADWVAGETRPSILLMAAVSLLLMVIACVTVANALLVRLAERKRELAVRASLGAGRGRILRQLLTEGLILSLAGTLGGLLLASALLPVFRSLVPLAFPRGDEMVIAPPFLFLAAGAGTLATLLALFVPAIQGTGLNLTEALKTSTGAASATRWRFALVAAQTTVATTLLVGCALLLISFWRLNRVDLGFDGTQVLTGEMRLMDPNYFQRGRLAWFQEQVVERVRALPGVLEVGITSAVPFRGVDWTYGISLGQDKRRYGFNARQVSPGYFSVMRLTLLRGRLLVNQDTSSSQPVMVVSDSFARHVFPGLEPLGQVFDLRGPRTIVGVVKDVRYKGFDQAPSPAIYIPRAQEPSELVCLVLRTAGRSENMAAMLQRVIHEIDPTVPVMDITTIDQIVSESVAGRRFYTVSVAAFAALALVLTATGLLVVIARSVAERRRELAIRSALGAQNRQLAGLVIRQGLIPVILGVGAGLLGAWLAARILQQFLFEVNLHEPAVYCGAGLFVIVVAALASFLPARRVGELPPAMVLQSE